MSWCLYFGKARPRLWRYQSYVPSPLWTTTYWMHLWSFCTKFCPLGTMVLSCLTDIHLILVHQWMTLVFILRLQGQQSEVNSSEYKIQLSAQYHWINDISWFWLKFRGYTEKSPHYTCNSRLLSYCRNTVLFLNLHTSVTWFGYSESLLKLKVKWQRFFLTMSYLYSRYMYKCINITIKQMYKLDI